MKWGPLVRVKAIEPASGYWVRIQFGNGVQRTVDLEPYLHGPIFQPIRRESAVFRAMKIEGGAITWENGADIDPDVLYYGLKPAWMEQVSPRPARVTETQGVAVLQVREAGGAQYDFAQETDKESSL
ncbi:MAG: hypothetical protein QG637_846 [Chloroflexota bacterium]|nr:hypothetical protein [Chloroflexota bacterium]